MSRRRPIVWRVMHALASPRLAAWVMVAMVALVIIGILVPQETYLTAENMRDFRESAPGLAAVLDAVALTRVYSSWWIAAVAGMLALNLIVCTVRRVWRRRQRPERIVASPAADVVTAVGWRVTSADGRGVIARRGSLGFWGSVVMHLGLLTVIVGGAGSALTSFRGTLAISEGQTIVDAPEAYIDAGPKPEIGTAYSGTLLHLDSMSIRYEQGERTAVVARMSAETPDGQLVTRDVRVNHPLEVAGSSYLLQESGYAPSIALSVGGQTENRVVRLSEATATGWRDAIAIGEVRQSGGDARIEMLATPVPLMPGQELPAEKFDIVDPRLRVTLVDDRGTLGEATLAPGQTVELTPGVVVTFEDLVLWNTYLVRRDPSRWIVYVGLWLAVAGMAARVVVPELRLSVRIDETGPRRARVAVRSWPLPSSRAEEAAERVRAELAVVGYPGTEQPE